MNRRHNTVTLQPSSHLYSRYKYWHIIHFFIHLHVYARKYNLKLLPDNVALFLPLLCVLQNLKKTPSPVQAKLQSLLSSKYLRTVFLVVVLSLSSDTVHVHPRAAQTRADKKTKTQSDRWEFTSILFLKILEEELKKNKQLSTYLLSRYKAKIKQYKRVMLENITDHTHYDNILVSVDVHFSLYQII